MTDENPRHDAGSIPPPPSRLPTSAIPVIEVDPEPATQTPAAPLAGSAASTPAGSNEPAGFPGAPGAPAAPPTAKPGAARTRAGQPSGSAAAGIVSAVRDRARPLARRIRPLAGRLGPLAGRVRRQGPKRLGAAAAILITIGLLAWWAVSAFAGSPQSSADGGSPAPAASSEAAPASRGTLPLEGVNPLDFQLRDCFKDFDPDAQKSTVVDCATAHSAQLVAVEKYAAGDSYPGRDELKQKARAACKAAPLADKDGDYDLSYKLAYPSSSSWGKGDRRVDCYAVTNAGNVIKKSLLP